MERNIVLEGGITAERCTLITEPNMRNEINARNVQHVEAIFREEEELSPQQERYTPEGLAVRRPLSYPPSL